MASKKDFFLNATSNTKHFGIRFELIDKPNNTVISLDRAEKILPFLQSAGVEFLELGAINAFDYDTKTDTSIFAKEPALISNEQLKPFSLKIDNSKPLAERISELKETIYSYTTNQKLHFPDLVNFSKNNEYWIKDYVCFVTLANYIGTKKFSNWPQNIKEHDRKSIAIAHQQLSSKILVEEILQFLVHKSYAAFVDTAHKYEISVALDICPTCEEQSSETWSKARLFFLNKQFSPTVYLGLPPSSLLESGIKYSKVPFRWHELYNDHFEFFRELFQHYQSLCDYAHLRDGHTFFHYWELSHLETDPQYGRWAPVKFDLFFEYVREYFNNFAYFWDFNEPLFPQNEIMVKRYLLLQSAILHEPTEHFSQNYDLSRPIHMLRSPLCNTKIELPAQQKADLLKSAPENLKSMLESKIPVQIINFSEVCAILNTDMEGIFAKPQFYGEKLKQILSDKPKINGTKNQANTESQTEDLTDKPKHPIIKKIFSIFS